MKMLLFVNLNKDKDLSLTAGIEKILKSKGVDYAVFKNGSGNISPGRKLLKGVDAVIVLGGDGTMLHAVREVCKDNIPVFGVNIGRMGFLTGVEYNDFEKALDSIIAGDYDIEERMLLEVGASGSEKAVALNDACIINRETGKIISLSVFVNDRFAQSFEGDGIIVSSPTGSTGYSLSAGGPIVSPMASCIIITPICAHSLTTKPLVLCDSERIHIRVESDKQGLLILDGQLRIEANELFVEKSAYKARFIRLKGYNFFDVLSQKFSYKELR